MHNEIAKVCIWRECRHEPEEGIKAVCHVINNRMISQKKSSYSIVTANLQFSSMTYKSDPQLALYPVETDPIYQQICAMFDTITLYTTSSEIEVDNTGGATFYRNSKTSTSTWFDNAIAAGKLVKTVTIGNHDFYKEV